MTRSSMDKTCLWTAYIHGRIDYKCLVRAERHSREGE